jgi:putative membrane protein
MNKSYQTPVRHVLCAASLLLLAGTVVRAADTTVDSSSATMSRDHDEHAALSRSDRRFVDKVAKIGMEEVALSRYAAEHATREDVRDFAQKLVSEHEKSNAELSLIASNRGFVLPTADKPNLDRWSKKKGQEFDKDYLAKMIDEHEDTIDALESAAKKAENSEVAAFARNNLAPMEEHLRHAKELKKMVD